MLYVKIKHLLFGLLRRVILFYRKLVAGLEKYGFRLNPDEPFLSKNIVNDHQRMVMYHVVHLKVSHKYPFDFVKFEHYLSNIFGEKLTVHQRKIHKYLVMRVYLSDKRLVKILMIKFDTFPEEIKSTLATPLADYIFKMRVEKNYFLSNRM